MYGICIVGISALLQYRFSSCCWVDDIRAGSWGLRIKSNFAENSSPITTMLPIIRLQYGCGSTIKIPGIIKHRCYSASQYILILPTVDDSDGDIFRCRWAKAEQRECGDYCQQISGYINDVID